MYSCLVSDRVVWGSQSHVFKVTLLEDCLRLRRGPLGSATCEDHPNRRRENEESDKKDPIKHLVVIKFQEDYVRVYPTLIEWL